MYLFMYVCIYYKLNMHYCTCSMHVKVHFCAIGKYVCSINVAKVCVYVCRIQMHDTRRYIHAMSQPLQMPW